MSLESALGVDTRQYWSVFVSYLILQLLLMVWLCPTQWRSFQIKENECTKIFFLSMVWFTSTKALTMQILLGSKWHKSLDTCLHDFTSFLLLGPLVATDYVQGVKKISPSFSYPFLLYFLFQRYNIAHNIKLKTHTHNKTQKRGWS